MAAFYLVQRALQRERVVRDRKDPLDTLDDIMAGMVLLVCCSWVVLLCLSVQAYENLALHQPAWQSSTLRSDYYGAERAVDGLYTDLWWSGGQCAMSEGGQTAEWRVDLGGVLSAQLARALANITCPYHGRYVIYYNNRTHPPYPEGYSDVAWNTLCEVEVYGCPFRGYYGENCSLECPQNCQEGYCDIVEGTCFGCAHRYMGATCTQDCPEGLYGRNCSQNCSMTCGDPGRCDIMTGHCSGGCQVGWTGAMCEKSYRLTIYNTHKNVYILKPSYISTIKDYLSYHNFMDYLFCLAKKNDKKRNHLTTPQHVMNSHNGRYC
ncbi:uncharacterized protein LOC111112261 [Crassostrea virginica]